MSFAEIWLLAVSLAIDCFTVSVTSGIILHRIRWGIFLKMAFFFRIVSGGNATYRMGRCKQFQSSD